MNEQRMYEGEAGEMRLMRFYHVDRGWVWGFVNVLLVELGDGVSNALRLSEIHRDLRAKYASR